MMWWDDARQAWAVARFGENPPWTTGLLRHRHNGQLVGFRVFYGPHRYRKADHDVWRRPDVR